MNTGTIFIFFKFLTNLYKDNFIYFLSENWSVFQRLVLVVGLHLNQHYLTFASGHDNIFLHVIHLTAAIEQMLNI